VAVRILAINDFEGALTSARRVAGRPVGGAAVLAAYLRAAQAGWEDGTVIVHAGDHVGASPPVSALLQDEPAITFFNMLGNAWCTYQNRMHPRCNLAGTAGNHEFDEGRGELFRLLFGGNHPNGPYLDASWRGARFPTVSANVVDAATGRPILPPYVIKEVRGVRIAFVGAVRKDTPTVVTPTGVEGLRFLDEAEAINVHIPRIRAQGVRAIVALIHRGGRQAQIYEGPTRPDQQVTGPIVDIVARLSPEVDVVVSGDAHSFLNARLPALGGKRVLVTQAFSSGTAYADIDLQVDPRTRDVTAASAAIVTTFADAGPGLRPDPAVAALVSRAEARVAPLVNRVVGQAATDIVRAQNPAGESPLGNLIADAQRAAMRTDFAVMNPGGIRTDLPAGPVTWGQLFAIQPFGNNLVRMTLTGHQIYDLLNQQWVDQPFPRMLQISGFTYTWDNARPVGDRIVEVRRVGAGAIDRTASYTVTVNSFLAAGGDRFTVLTQATNREVGMNDLEAMVAYLQRLPQPFSSRIEGRITRLN
jgi:5'-nucleotidase